MNALRLAAWDRLERGRRAASRPLWARLVSGPARAVVLGLIAAGLLHALALRSGAGEARGAWTLLCVLLTALLVMRAPYRMFWHASSVLLARLPLSGEALWGLALRRSVRAGGEIGVFLLLAALPRLVDGPIVFLRYVVVAVVGAATGALLAPAAGALAGSIVASARAQAAVASVAAESAGPPTTWLSIIPALGGAVAGWSAALLCSWAGEGEVVEGLRAAVWSGPIGVFALVSALAGQKLFAGKLSDATREVAALDVVKLASVQLDGAKGLEAVWGRAVAGAGFAGALYRKDVAMARRRFPLFFLLSGLGLVVLWILALAGGAATRARWGVGIGVGLSVYVAVFGGRLARPPIERPRLLAVWPAAPGEVWRAKWAFVSWRAIFVVLCVAPALFGAADRGVAVGVAAAAILVGAVVAGVAATRKAEDVVGRGEEV